MLSLPRPQFITRYHALNRSLHSDATRPDLNQPFTRSILEEIRGRLSPSPTPQFRLPEHTVKFTRRPASEAAVLVPLMNIEEVPHVLLEVRAAKMRTHAGEISFPGGKVDPEDESITTTALRETYEELKIPPENVEILGMLNRPEYSLGNKARVWPMIGFIHSSSSWSTTLDNSSNAPLRSLALYDLHPSLDEVSAILPLPLSTLLDESRRRVHHFRLDPSRPYYCLKAGDLALPAHPAPGTNNEAGAGQDVAGLDPGLEVWGLSGWVLNRLAWRLGWMGRPKVEQYDNC